MNESRIKIKCIVVITEEIFELLVKINISLNKLNEKVKDYLNEDISFKLYSENDVLRGNILNLVDGQEIYVLFDEKPKERFDNKVPPVRVDRPSERVDRPSERVDRPSDISQESGDFKIFQRAFIFGDNCPIPEVLKERFSGIIPGQFLNEAINRRDNNPVGNRQDAAAVGNLLNMHAQGRDITQEVLKLLGIKL